MGSIFILPDTKNKYLLSAEGLLHSPSALLANCGKYMNIYVLCIYIIWRFEPQILPDCFTTLLIFPFTWKWVCKNQNCLQCTVWAPIADTCHRQPKLGLCINYWYQDIFPEKTKARVLLLASGLLQWQKINFLSTVLLKLKKNKKYYLFSKLIQDVTHTN